MEIAMLVLAVELALCLYFGFDLRRMRREQQQADAQRARNLARLPEAQREADEWVARVFAKTLSEGSSR